MSMTNGLNGSVQVLPHITYLGTIQLMQLSFFSPNTLRSRLSLLQMDRILNVYTNCNKPDRPNGKQLPVHLTELSVE